MSLIVNTQSLTAFFNISRRTLTNWQKAGCPKYKRGQWDLKAVFDWWWENMASERAAQQGGDESMNEAKRRYWWEKAKGEQYKNEQLSGNLIPRHQIAKEWSWRVSEVANGLGALADRLPPLLEGKCQAEMRQIIADETWKMRDHFARKGKFCPAPEKRRGKRKKGK